MNGLDISDEQIEHLRLLPDSGPVIMANFASTGSCPLMAPGQVGMFIGVTQVV